MSDPRAGDLAAEPVGTLQARLAAMRSEGAWRVDPVRFHYLEALSRRVDGQPGAVGRWVQDKLRAALAEYAHRASKSPLCAATAPRPAQPETQLAPAPLAELNRYLLGASRAAQEPALDTAERPSGDELANARRFKRAWSRLRMQEQLSKAAARQPLNAGPLNSHLLVLHSLALLESLSPEYLERFLSQVESLQWLSRAGDRHADNAAGPAKASKPKRSRSKG